MVKGFGTNYWTNSSCYSSPQYRWNRNSGDTWVTWEKDESFRENFAFGLKLGPIYQEMKVKRTLHIVHMLHSLGLYVIKKLKSTRNSFLLVSYETVERLRLRWIFVRQSAYVLVEYCQKGLYYFTKGQEIARFINNAFTEANAQFGMGDIYLNMGETEKARGHYLCAAEQFKENGYDQLYERVMNRLSSLPSEKNS